MKYMPVLLPRLVFGALVAVAAFTSPLAASEIPRTLPSTGSLENKAREEFESMMVKLDLSDSQKAQVRPVYEAALTRGNALVQTVLKELTSKKSSSEKAAALERSKKELQSLRDDTDTQLAQILTPEQMTEMKKVRSQRGKELKKQYKPN
jgi:Spy/CpxP family protein refolding chaperone